MSPTFKTKIAKSFVETQELNYEYKKLAVRDADMDSILDATNERNKALLRILKNEEAYLEQVEQEMSDSDEMLYLEYLKNMISPTHKSKVELYEVLKNHKFSRQFKSVLEALEDSIDYSNEIINDIDLKISLLENDFL